MEKDTIFSSRIKYNGIFNFKEFYKFCYDWLIEETEFKISEDKYIEKIFGDSKDIEIKWTGKRKLTDYFLFEGVIELIVRKMTKIEINQQGIKIETNKGNAEIKVKGMLIRDYQGKFERNASQKFLRGIYEKWIIPSRVEEYENKIIAYCNDFLEQAKAYLDIEGKK